jgi:hypothetical protein
MATAGGEAHTLIVYGAGRGADAALRRLADSASAHGRRLTVLKPAVQESEDRGCCDTRSVLWNEISRDLARDDLARATRAVEGHDGVHLEVVFFSGRRLADVILRELLARDADEVLLVGAPLGAMARRRLRRMSSVPVSAA